MSSQNELTRIQRQEDLAAVLRLAAGRRLVRRLLGLSNILGPSYAPGDAQATAYNEGLRRMGMVLLAEIRDAAPETIPALITPHKEEQNVTDD